MRSVYTHMCVHTHAHFKTSKAIILMSGFRKNLASHNHIFQKIRPK